MDMIIIIHMRVKPLGTIKHIGIPGWFSHACEVDIQTLSLSNLRMKMYSFQYLASKIKERCVLTWADLWDVTELTSHGATILSGYCHYPLLCQWHKSLMLDSFMLIQVHIFAIIAEGEELQESLLSLDHANIARRHRQVACDLHVIMLLPEGLRELFRFP